MSRLIGSLFLLLVVPFVALAQQDRQLIAVSTYQIETEENAKKFDEMMEAAVDALSNHGIKQVGVFKLADPSAAKEFAHMRVTVVAYDDAGDLLGQGAAFQNGEFWQSAEDYLTSEEPPFKRIERVLLHAFTEMPKLAVPGDGDGKRIFELRVYESPNELNGLIKVQMFNEGEIELFEKVGLPAIFYGSAVAASNSPQLTYMLVHDNKDAQKAGWKKFIQSPEWADLQKQEPYAGKKLVSKIKKTELVATDYSQIK